VDRSRIGKKAAYQKQPIVWYLEREDRIHGARPWQYVHIDHTQIEIFCRGTKSRKNLGKPWLSLAIDAESRTIVGFVLSFEKPSYRSCMMLIRDIVRRHNHLPEFIVLDNGKEFHSQSFTRLAEIYGVTLTYRPAGEARFGTLVERMFGTTHSKLIHRLKGNTKLLRNPRAMSQAVNPEGRQVWTLYALHHLLDHYFLEDYGATPHPALKGFDYTKPVEHFLQRSHETGERNHRLVRYDTQLLIETCPEPRGHGSTREVDCQRGIKVQHLYYQSKIFHQPRMGGKTVQVRVDPWDPRFVYALVDDHWERCVSQEAMRLRKYTELERRYANEMTKDAMREFRPLDPDRLTEWMKECDPEKYDPILAEQQHEIIRLYDPLKMTDVQCLKKMNTDHSLNVNNEILNVPKPLTKAVPRKKLDREARCQTLSITTHQVLDSNPNRSVEKESFYGYDLL
jgi:putative transposase